MTINELGDMLDRDLIIRRYSNQGERYSARLDGVEVKESKHSGILHGAYGCSTSPQGAVVDYINKIKGKLLVINATSPTDRRQLNVPQTLTL